MMPRGITRRGSTYAPVFAALASGTLVFGICVSGMNFQQARNTVQALPVANMRKSANARIQEPIQPVPTYTDLDPNVVALGSRLFHEPRLSATKTISCASCHPLDQGGVDHRKVSIGIDGRAGKINAPTVFNSGLNYVQFWDGRAASLESQVDGPLTNNLEMGSSWPEVLKLLTTDQSYRKQFSKAFGTLATADLVRRAIADFERSLTTPDSRFDQWLMGSNDLLSEAEHRGYQLFKSYRCASCHQGSNVGGNSFQRLGVMVEYFTGARPTSEADYGRFNVTHDEADRYVFRVPPLRNVDLTAPYFHDGSAQTLRQAVEVMIECQLGRAVVKEDVDDIVSFLMSLRGKTNLEAIL